MTAAAQPLTLALAQVAGGGSLADNVGQVRRLAAQAAAAQAAPDFLVFPECFLTGYYVDDVRRCAITADAAHSALRDIALECNIGLVCGYIEQRGSKICNAAMVVDARGALLATYAKRYLYGDWEKRNFAVGESSGAFKWRGWQIGLCICYDIEFPETARALAVAGARAIIAPTALMAQSVPDADGVFALLKARAIENGVFVAYANRIGGERELRYVGGSRILDASGSPLALAGAGGEEIISATLPQPPATSAYLRDLGCS